MGTLYVQFTATFTLRNSHFSRGNILLSCQANFSAKYISKFRHYIGTMRYSSNIVLYAAVAVALSGCSSDNSPVTSPQPSLLEQKLVLAQERTDEKKDELDLSTPEKAVEA